MAEQQINPVTKQILELGPPMLFFVAYLYMRDETYSFGGTDYSGFIVAAAIFVPILLASMAILWKLTGKLSRMQVFTIVMVVLFGGLTVWFNDEKFFKMKTTLVYGLFAVILGIGLLQGRSYLAWIMAEFLPMTDEGWMKLTWRLTLFFAGLAAANEIVWRTMSTDAWVKIETFGFPILMFLFLWGQILTLQRYLIDEEAGEN
ncbi:inner membrane-spanning protein YciB [Silicimonas sp. MF1-12-2]|uniref:inner membrane-spanning protein YciB n=1 Tax=Silicimonas sp. MF1-12-2 TaxID=3384793 RepID=UPI0039B5DB28